MRFGLHYLRSCADGQSPASRYRETLEQATRAEGLGFESVWPVEHHFHPALSISPCPALLLAAVAARTRTLRLGTAIVQLPLAHPLRVAEDLGMRGTTYASVDAVTGIFDTPAACVERLLRVREEFAPGRVICWFNFGGLVPHDRVLRSMELFAERVMPHFSG